MIAVPILILGPLTEHIGAETEPDIGKINIHGWVNELSFTPIKLKVKVEVSQCMAITSPYK